MIENSFGQLLIAGEILDDNYEIDLSDLTLNGCVWYVDAEGELQLAVLQHDVVDGLHADCFYSQPESVAQVSATDAADEYIELSSLVCLIWIVESQVRVSLPQHEYVWNPSALLRTAPHDHYICEDKPWLCFKDEGGNILLIASLAIFADPVSSEYLSDDSNSREH